MKTHYTTSGGWPGGYQRVLAASGTFWAVQGYRSGPAASSAAPLRGCRAGSHTSAVMCSNGLTYSSFMYCLALVGLLLAARLVAGHPPEAVSNKPVPNVPRAMPSPRQAAPGSQPETIPLLFWVAAPPANLEGGRGRYAEARAGPVATGDQ